MRAALRNITRLRATLRNITQVRAALHAAPRRDMTRCVTGSPADPRARRYRRHYANTIQELSRNGSEIGVALLEV